MVRIAFVPLSEREFDVLIRNSHHLPKLSGGSLNSISIYKSKFPYKRGGGIFSFLSKLGQTAFPIIKKYIMPSVGEFGNEVIGDIASGINIRKSLKSRGINNLKQVGNKILGGGKGSRKIRKIKNTNMKKKGEKKYKIREFRVSGKIKK